MKGLGTVELETKRLKLRKLKNNEEDLYYIYHYLDNDERVMRYVRALMEPLGNNTELYLELTVKRYQNPYFFTWGIVLENTDIVIGTIDIFNIDQEKCYGEIGFRLAYNFWNCGYMKEALGAVLDFVFNEVGFKTLCAYQDERNIASRKVLEYHGFKVKRSLDFLPSNSKHIQLNIFELTKN